MGARLSLRFLPQVDVHAQSFFRPVRSHQFGKLQKIIMSEGVRQRTAPSEATSVGHTYEQKGPRNGVKKTQQQR